MAPRLKPSPRHSMKPTGTASRPQLSCKSATRRFSTRFANTELRKTRTLRNFLRAPSCKTDVFQLCSSGEKIHFGETLFFVKYALRLSAMESPKKVSTLYSHTADTPSVSDFSLRCRLPRILVVDDNVNTMTLMQDLLSSRGYDVVSVPTAADAEAEIFRRAPDLVLSDVIMPGKSGYELCRDLKENPATRLIPFVLITGLT